MEVWIALLASHEAGCLRQIPGTLRLVEEGDVLYRRAVWVFQPLVAEVMNILDKRLDFTFWEPLIYSPLSHTLPTRVMR